MHYTEIGFRLAILSVQIINLCIYTILLFYSKTLLIHFLQQLFRQYRNSLEILFPANRNSISSYKGLYKCTRYRFYSNKLTHGLA